jgi:beta-mannosidase
MRCILIVINLIFSFSVLSQQNLEWEFFHPIKKEWIGAGQFGSVQEVLIAKGELPDPFVGVNESKFDWIEEYIWEYRSSIDIDSVVYNSKFIELFLPWVDTYAKVYLNDSLILETSNSFLPYSVQIKENVQLGQNRIRVTFIPPILKNAQNTDERGVFYPAPNDVGKIQVAPLVRKPQYQFGWDWSMRMNTIGFIKPVTLYHYSFPRVSNIKVEAEEFTDSLADMNFQLKFFSEFNSRLNIQSKYIGSQRNVEVENGKIELSFELLQPTLWWPRGQGEAFMYYDTLILYTTYGKFIDAIPFSFGVRKSELVREKDSIGTSYYFKINGRPIFCKGANLIPLDIFPSRVKKEDIRFMVNQMVESNFNIVRVWGGGYYPDDFFYDLCDKSGIMVWQDFMFACAMYPSENSFIDNVKEELNYQIPRISRHPSVIQFNGNNEVDVAWKYWGFQDKYAISKKNQDLISRDYFQLFKLFIPELVIENTNIPYIHTSPLGHWINKEDFPHGTQHYWGVWHGKDPIEDFGKKSGRFNAEYGFQSFPEFSTLLKFSSTKDWSLNSEIMKSHQKSYVGNGMIKKHSDLLYGKTTDFKTFVYYSQLTQVKAVSIAISSHRLLNPICMGTIFWQLNDCWPAPTWSSIDYYGNWKALQYRVKDDYKDVTILEKTDKIGAETYFLISDLPSPIKTNLKVELYSMNGSIISKNEKEFNLNPNEPIQLFKDCVKPNWQKLNYLVKFSWNDENGNENSRAFVHIGNKKNYVKALRSQFYVTINSIDTITKTAIIEVKTQQFLQDFWISCNKQTIKFENNFVQILPGKKEIKITFTEIPKIEDFQFMWR